MNARQSAGSRYPLLAVIFAVVGTPFTAMLYLGRGRRAVAYLLMVIACPVVSYWLARGGWWPDGISWVVLYVLITAAGAVDAYRIATPLRHGFAGTWYSHWKALVAVAVAYGLVSLGIRSMLFEPFRIPAASMLPTLQVGDHFFANKFVYGFRLPFTSIELTDGEAPARGDVVVFRPGESGVRYIKRIIGLPGDVVTLDPATNRLLINGELVAADTSEATEQPGVVRVTETLGEHEYDLLLRLDARSPGGVYEVPEGHYFVLGDNRDNSMDSRYETIGFVAEEDIVGRASSVWWNTSDPARAGLRL